MTNKFTVTYVPLKNCPLCGTGDGVERARLLKPHYFFGSQTIPLPELGIPLIECSNCSLLYKSLVPSPADLTHVMSQGATSVWRPKKGVHPALNYILPYVAMGESTVLEIGAANGELLFQLQGYVGSTSALDIVEFPPCREAINGEYLIGNIELSAPITNQEYDLILLFDVFEHFLNISTALNNITNMLSMGGKLIVETGDWDLCKSNLSNWYYCNLFEHQIFWNRKSFEFLCSIHSFKILKYENKKHKSRINLHFFKRKILTMVVYFSKIDPISKLISLIFDQDISRFSPPLLIDHAFVVIEKPSQPI